MLKVSRFNNFYCVIFSIIVICIANFWLFALCCFLQINRFYIWFKKFLLGIARISLTPPWHFRSAILNQRHIEGTISLSSTSWLVFGCGLSSKPEWLSPNSPHQGFVVTLQPSPKLNSHKNLCKPVNLDQIGFDLSDKEISAPDRRFVIDSVLGRAPSVRQDMVWEQSPVRPRTWQGS